MSSAPVASPVTPSQKPPHKAAKPQAAEGEVSFAACMNAESDTDKKAGKAGDDTARLTTPAIAPLLVSDGLPHPGIGKAGGESATTPAKAEGAAEKDGQAATQGLLPSLEQGAAMPSAPTHTPTAVATEPPAFTAAPLQNGLMPAPAAGKDARTSPHLPKAISRLATDQAISPAAEGTTKTEIASAFIASTAENAAGAAPVADHLPQMASQPLPNMMPQLATTPLLPAAASLSAAAAPSSPCIASAAVPMDALPMTIAAQAQEGARQFTIRLDPAELGRVEISLSIAEDGTTRTHMIVERPSTLHQLMQDAPRLEQALAQAGVAADDNGVTFSLQQDNGHRNGQPATTDNGHAAPEPDGEHPLTHIAHYRPLASSAGRLDMTL